MANSSSLFDAEGFRIVKRKGKGKGNTFQDHTTTSSRLFDRPQNQSEVFVDFDAEKLRNRLLENQQELRLSELLQDCTVSIKDALNSLAVEESCIVQVNSLHEGNIKFPEKRPHLVGYGIGRFSSCPIARYQLAFFLLLHEQLKTVRPLLYDPVFSEKEKTFLEKLDCEIISHNEEGKRPCESPTIFFMPHCGKALYNNLVWTNLSRLHNALIIGNSFSSMIERTPENQLMKTANYVMKVFPYTVERTLKTSTFSHSDVFNDLSLHTFPISKLKDASPDFYEGNVTPVYDNCDVEIIQKRDSDGSS